MYWVTPRTEWLGFRDASRTHILRVRVSTAGSGKDQGRGRGHGEHGSAREGEGRPCPCPCRSIRMLRVVQNYQTGFNARSMPKTVPLEPRDLPGKNVRRARLALFFAFRVQSVTNVQRRSRRYIDIFAIFFRNEIHSGLRVNIAKCSWWPLGSFTLGWMGVKFVGMHFLGSGVKCECEDFGVCEVWKKLRVKFFDYVYALNE